MLTKKKSNSSKSLGSKGKGPIVNGFHTLIEASPLTLDEEKIAPLTMPQEILTWDPPPETVITPFKNGDKERKIHLNLELTEEELKQLADLQELAKKEGNAFYPSLTCMATRFLSRARGDPKKALKLMCNTQEWRANFFKDGPVTDESVMEDLRHGIVYFTGRDKALRPAIVIRATRVPKQWYVEKRVDKLIRILIFCMEYFMRYMIYPGRVENNCVIVDLKGLGVSQVPMGALAQVYNVMSHHYIGRVFRFYVCNLSGMLATLTSAVKGLLTDRQRQKLVFVSDKKELTNEFALHHLEEDLGGTRPPITEFYPWPMLGGPFDGASTKGEAKEGRIPGVHKLLTRQGSMGTLWDKNRSREDNLKVDYNVEDAEEIFKRCNVPIPADLQKEIDARAAEAAEKAKKDAEREAAIAAGETIQEEPPQVVEEEEEEEEEEEAQDVNIQDESVKPAGFFSCRCCVSNSGKAVS
mmetsp:Transcript_92324/g.169378  ORF Transcript_92324/g.169378 Transcript_92324/m.169378 type:complete len:468 (-) Transcript_92324:198-1601(-)